MQPKTSVTDYPRTWVTESKDIGNTQELAATTSSAPNGVARRGSGRNAGSRAQGAFAVQAPEAERPEVDVVLLLADLHQAHHQPAQGLADVAAAIPPLDHPLPLDAAAVVVQRVGSPARNGSSLLPFDFDLISVTQ